MDELKIPPAMQIYLNESFREVAPQRPTKR